MKKIISIVLVLLLVFSMLPATLSAATTTSSQPVIWVDTDGDGYEDYTDSLGNMWITLTIDEEGNRLIISKDILGVVQFEDEFDFDTSDRSQVWDNYATSSLKEEMDTFYNGGDSDTKINDTVYYLAPELKAIAQPVVLPDNEELVFAEDNPETPEEEHAYVTGYSGGMSYVDESGETTCFALSASEMFTYLTPEGEANGNVSVPTRAAVHSTGSNYATTGEDYSPDDRGEDIPGGSGWQTRSSAVAQGNGNYGIIKANSTGLVGANYVDSFQGFRPAVWVGEADTDMDGLTDGYEAENGTDPLKADSDADGLTDGDEVNKYTTDPSIADTDEDGLKDGDEVKAGTNPLNKDSDADGISDSQEPIEGTSPTNPDTDMDGILDGEELIIGTDPSDSDTDNDGLIDGTAPSVSLLATTSEVVYGELDFGTDPLDADSDNDGLSDGDEAIELGTDPLDLDTDNDGVNDGDEVELGINPLDADSDNDGLMDGEEIDLGTDPLNSDSDNDGVTDGEEVAAGTNPNIKNITNVVNDDEEEEEAETLADTGSTAFIIAIAIAVSAFAFAMYTRIKAVK